MTKQDKVEKVMHEWKEGKLTSHGKVVTDYDQAVAIALSESGLSKYDKGGEFEDADDFIEDVKEMHEAIDYIVLKDGTKIEGEKLMEKGGNINKYARGGSFTKKEYDIPYDLKITGIYTLKTSDGKEYKFAITGFERENDDEFAFLFSGWNREENNDLRAVIVKNSAIRKMSKGETVIARTPNGEKGKLTRIADSFMGMPIKEENMNEYSKGGNVIERRYVNKDEDYETRYAKDKPMRKGYNDERMFEGGGEMGKKLKGYRVYVFESSLSSSQNVLNGDSYILVTDGVHGDSSEVDSDEVYLKLVKRKLFGKEYIHAEPINVNKSGNQMFGGKFVWSTDSRFREDISEQPIQLHDRVESYALGGGIDSDEAIETYVQYKSVILERVGNNIYLRINGKTWKLTKSQLNELLEDLEEYSNPLTASEFLMDIDKSKYENITSNKFAVGGGIAEMDENANLGYTLYHSYETFEEAKKIVDKWRKDAPNYNAIITKDELDEKRPYNVLLTTGVGMGKRVYAVGGEIGNTVSFKGDYGTPRSGVIKEKRGSSYIVGTDDGDRLVDSYEVISFSETPIAKKKRFGFFEGGGDIEFKKGKGRGVVKEVYFKDGFRPSFYVSYDDDENDIKKGLKSWCEIHNYNYDDIVKVKYAGGGEIENKIEKLKKVVSSKMLPESVKAKAQAEIDKLEKELHESKETKAEEKAEHKFFNKQSYSDENWNKIKSFLSKKYTNDSVDEILDSKIMRYTEPKTYNGFIKFFKDYPESFQEFETKSEEKEEHEVGGSEARLDEKEELNSTIQKLYDIEAKAEDLINYQSGGIQGQSVDNIKKYVEYVNKEVSKLNVPFGSEVYDVLEDENAHSLNLTLGLLGFYKNEKDNGDWAKAQTSYKNLVDVVNEVKGGGKPEAKKPTTIKFGNITFTIDSAELENGGDVYGGHIDIYNRIIKGFPYNYKTAKEVEERMKSYIKGIKSATYHGSKGRESQKLPYLVIFNDGQAEIKEKFETAKEALNFNKVLDSVVNSNNPSKPTTKKAPVKKAPVKKAVAKKVEVKKEIKTPSKEIVDYFKSHGKKEAYLYNNRIGFNKGMQSKEQYNVNHDWISKQDEAKPKADHKKLVAKLKAKKGGKEYDNRASLVPFTDKRRERSESSDKKRSALPPGKRVSENGVTYYENRLNRTDLSKKDKFEKGGEVKGSDWGLNLNW